MPFGAIAITAFFIIGYQRNTINLSWHIIPILILYPTWGTIQQFLVVGLVAGNLQHLKVSRPGEVFIITITAILFAVMPYPGYWLIAGTLVLALLYTYIYLRDRNIRLRIVPRMAWWIILLRDSRSRSVSRSIRAISLIINA